MGRPRIRRNLAYALLIPTVLALCGGAHAAGDGFLLDGGGGKEGSIKLKDQDGRWRLVQGVPANPRPTAPDSVTIAVIDSGVLADHPQLRGVIAEQKDFTGEGPADRIGHGTVVAILLLSPAGQLSPEEEAKQPSPRIIVAKVANADGSISKQSVIEAIRWSASRGAKIVNLSLGFVAGSDDFSDLCAVIAENRDMMFVAAAGNFGPKVKVYPAACHADNLLSVAATDASGGVAPYSGAGDVAAPGGVTLVPSNH